VVVASALVGTMIHATGAAIYHAGQKTFDSSWLYWYAGRPLVGVGLALIIYFGIRGGLLTVGTDTKTLNLFGIAAVSGIAGMFTREATEKLQSTADTLFNPRKFEKKPQDLTLEAFEHRPVRSRNLTHADARLAALIIGAS